MNEFAPRDNHERAEGLQESYEAAKNRAEAAVEKAAEQSKSFTSHELDSIRSSIEQAALPAHETRPIAQERPSEDHNPWYMQRELRLRALKQGLSQVRSRLPRSDRTLSKAIHHPVVRTASDNAAKTIGRPSGLLGGGICALLSSILFFYLAKHIGFSYNYLLSSIFFIGGFAVGLLIELVVSFASGKRGGSTGHL